ncbi:class I SAM-dependent methyltransferase [Brevibacillus composti]|uniref:Class I SAM-dependent methyltransferase n=1 Tax=Brevibacillus composti TaxID=2796470 RepID=A0A7T5JPV2_9BACL|nr:class I SAM-dependent methyltransferase [Brevibacillus composti]QQE75823.1 class I SAM-dependent methyltransferase [Brevibacillus composti]QUO42849.1 class I SAM-dependent methyltransferase [Brevibacillus composti]
MSMSNAWNSQLYDNKMSFVSAFGKGVLEWLQPAPGEKILDLGCGTGDLAQEMAAAGAYPTGIDHSAEMIATAKKKYPHLPFLVADAHTFRTAEEYDAVFSNAALHWMKQPEDAIESIWLALRPGGRFVAEFGGAGNVEQVVHALRVVLASRGIDADQRMPWYFPSIGAYATLLERQGFTVTMAHLFERPTPLGDGEAGLNHWLQSFCGPFFAGMPSSQIKSACLEIAEVLRPQLFQDGTWVIDYKRIRVAALKPAR